jgi:NADH-quinone oxidoreductase subunit G
MAKEVTLTIDNQSVTVPEGTIVVDAAKKIGINIPVFCYHPKLKPAGMCRVCLVEVGRPVRDRETGEVKRNEDGSPQIGFGPKLDTACTIPVCEGMMIVTNSDVVRDSRRDVLEFLLTSHPLDCPVCDKGGECPLQNLTMSFGPGESRFIFDDKKNNEKHVPLGELIYLDRERCIHCARCVRFQEEIADDPVIGFFNRGRSLEIITHSDPGFDSIFSGNTTDICPVGALTSADFRFGARPWQVTPVASICNHCPVGCNTTLDVRREARSGGDTVVKRIMPRQNEYVNELWICDKGRFGYHYTESDLRLRDPLVRKNGELEAVTWGEALDLVAEKLKTAGKGLVTLAGGRLPNEDLFNLRKLTASQEGLAVLASRMGGGDLVGRFGAGEGTNFGDMGAGTAILVVASDLHQEAPLWWLRVKEAAARGATLIALNPRSTRLDKFASHVVRYPYGEETTTLSAFLPGNTAGGDEALKPALKAFAEAEDVVILFGGEGLDLTASTALAGVCADVLVKSDHIGRANNGLIGVWQNGNTQGAWDMGFRPAENLIETLGKAQIAYVVAADPVQDEPEAAEALKACDFVVVQDLFMTSTAELADVVLPAAPFTEREGSYTSGERRVQRFYPAVTGKPGARADFAIAAQLAERLGIEMEGKMPLMVMQQIATEVPGYSGATYQKLAEVWEQEPLVGREDLYYGGTSYENTRGLGVKLAPVIQDGEDLAIPAAETSLLPEVPEDALLAVPITKLYDQGRTLLPSTLLNQRMAKIAFYINPQEAEERSLIDGETVQVELDGGKTALKITLDKSVPKGVALIARSAGVPISKPVVMQIQSQVPEFKE